MVSFTNEQKTFILAQHHECQSDERVRRRFITHFKVSRTESKHYYAKIFKRIYDNFIKTGSTLKPKVDYPIRINETPIVAKFIENPKLSLRSAQRSLAKENVKASKETIRTILRRKTMKPYKTKKVHTISAQNVEKRVTFAFWFLNNRQLNLLKIL